MTPVGSGLPTATRASATWHAGGVTRTGARSALPEDRWYTLLLMSRLLGAVVALGLLLAHRVTDHDALLAGLGTVWTALSLGAFGRLPRLRASAVAWAADGLAALGLVLASGDWRSPFYLVALTALILPGTRLPFRGALLWSAGFSAAYALVSLQTHKLPADTIGNTIRLETLVTHLVLPVMVTLALAYASALLARLRSERERSEWLAVQAERQRIAWELHDSAKQRVHATHLLLSALDGRLDDGNAALVTRALAEVRAAAADMETSIAELRTPVVGRPVHELLQERAAGLALAANADIVITGRLRELPPTVAAHTYRIAAEAVTNAVRHARCSRVDVRLDGGRDGPIVVVQDNGVGLPRDARRDGHGLRSMRARAETIGAELEIGPAPTGHGTRVRLHLPATIPRGDP
jgi:signal transduction histidine kinase